MGFKELYIASLKKYDETENAEYDIKKTQEESLIIFDAFKSICDKHQLIFMMGGGSALGTVRHHGFIPWDDDIDINMPRDDFEKFKAVSAEMGESFVFCSPNFSKSAVERFGKIFLKNGPEDRNWRGNTSIDIFVIENLPKNQIHRAVKGAVSSFFMGLAAMSLFYNTRTKKTKEILCQTLKGSIIYYSRLLIGFCVSFVPTVDLFDLVDRVNQHPKKTGISGVPSGRKHYYGEQFPTTVYLPTVEGVFEGRIVPIENMVDKYLTNLYGSDYMEIPPEHKRERHSR